MWRMIANNSTISANVNTKIRKILIFFFECNKNHHYQNNNDGVFTTALFKIC